MGWKGDGKGRWQRAKEGREGRVGASTPYIPSNHSSYIYVVSRGGVAYLEILAIGLDSVITQQLALKGVLRALFNMKLEALFFRPFCNVQQIMQSEDLDDYYTMIG
ncbi:hypothetical protein BOTNAR_0352g00010 [Botryotinia narcissicola]|uniref:Uncharacterized protein n=1 Tax=Botryotinia narcissicola TaxID=278944 RepID=A0A4Z1HRW6_9HELO|nr:hypothetical protein BOTNAR_0352g00010 [Botryotinia narcissicola]